MCYFKMMKLIKMVEHRRVVLRVDLITLKRDNLANFNRVTLDLHSIRVRIMIRFKLLFCYVLCRNHTKIFINTMLYGRDSITINNVKDNLQFTKLKRRVSSFDEDDA